MDSGNSFTGGSGTDTFNGIIVNTAAANSTGTTFSAGDNINGGSGTDTLSIAITGTVAGTNAGTSISGIERVLVSNVSGQTQSIDMSLVDSSLATVGHSSSNAGAVTTFSGLNKIVATELSNGSAGVTLTYNASVIAGSADAASLTLSNQTGGTFTSTGIETLSVASNIVANTVTLAAGPTTVNVSGATKLTLGQLDATIATLNASANTGGLVATLSDTGTAVITGSSAADTFTAGTNMTGVGAVNAGDGIDTLVSTANALIAATADGARFTNFETLSISSLGLGVTATRAQNMSQIAGITTLNVTSARADGTANDTTHGVTLSNLAATTNTLNITGLANADTTDGGATTDDLSVTVTATRAVNTTADSITVNLGTSLAVSGANAVADNGDIGRVILDVSLANEETITINSLGGTTGTNVIDDLTNTAATSVVLTGARGLTIDSMTSTVVTSINASAMTGAFIMSTGNAGAVASTISGGTAADTLLGGSAADNISGGAGNDSITGADGNDVITGGDGLDTIVGGVGIDNLSGGAGDDTFSVTTVADFISLASAEVVSGGEGNDTLSFSQASTIITVAAADLLGINSIQTISINGTDAAGSITLTDAVYTANGATTLSIVDGLLDGNTTGTLSVNATALTAANSISVTANTVTGNNDTLIGGAGNDTFFFAIDGLQAADTVTGGAGTDTISISAAATVVAVMNGVTLVESIVTTGSAADVSITVGADTVIAAAGTLTTNASSMNTGGTIELTYNGAGISTATKIQNVTGSAGDDIIAGGAGNDIIVGGDGIDSITGGDGIDNLSGGAGNDIFLVATLGAGFVGQVTAETVSGGTGNDTLKFTKGVLVVAAADLVSVSGIETIQILNDTETASLTLTDAFFTTNGAATLAVDSVTATTGVLTLAASTLSAANSIQLNTGGTTTGAHVINFGAGNDTLTTTAVAMDNVTTLAGGAGTDTLALLTGGTATFVTTVTGFETVSFSTAAGNYALTVVNEGVAAAATQTINGSNLTGTLLWNGAAEADGKFSITGGSGADSLTGGTLVDTISGGAGDDVITGGSGADALAGGIGADTFVYASVAQSNGTNTDTITDFVTTSDKLQVTLNYGSLTNALDIKAERASTGVAGTTLAQDALSGQRGQYIYDTTGSALYINFNADNLLTTADYKIGINAASTAINSIAVNDINFVITGGTNADVIVAGGGADTITGASGADAITGGAGADVFVTALGASVARTAFVLTDAGIAVGNTITFGNGLDIINDFTTTVDDIDVTTAATAPTALLAVDPTGFNLTANTTYYLSGTFVAATGVFTVTANAAAGSSTLLLTHAVAGDADAATQTSWVLLAGVVSTSVVQGDFI